MILVVVAMKEEASEILKIEKLKHDVIVTGVGKVNAAMKLAEYLSKNRVHKIINIGFAGGNKTYDVNDVVIIDYAKYHDFDLTMFGYEVGQVPGFPESFKPDQNMLRVALKILKNAKRGHLFTGDYFMTSEVVEPTVFDMEGTSLFQVAHYFNVPMISVKLISDVIGLDEHIENYKAFEQSKGSHLLANICKDLIGGF